MHTKPYGGPTSEAAPEMKADAQQPFSANGDSNEPSPGAQTDVTSADAAGPMTHADRPLARPPASETSAPDEQRSLNHGPRGKFVVGNQAARTHGLTRAKPVFDDGPDASQADMASYRSVWLIGLWREACEHIASLSTAMRDRPQRVRSLRNVQQLVNLFEQARTIDAELRASAPPPTVSGAFANAVRIFAAHANEFEHCMRQVLSLQPSLAEALRVVLAEQDATLQHEQPPEQQPEPDVAVSVRAEGVPRFRIDEPDEIEL